jgi:DNA-binding XRE family transcriptional regulator
VTAARVVRAAAGVGAGPVAVGGSAAVAVARAGNADFLRRLGRAIRAARKKRGYSQEGLARAAGVSRNFVGSLETGRHCADVVRLRLVAVALDLPLSDLFADVPAFPWAEVSTPRCAVKGGDHV